MVLKTERKGIKDNRVPLRKSQRTEQLEMAEGDETKPSISLPAEQTASLNSLDEHQIRAPSSNGMKSPSSSIPMASLMYPVLVSGLLPPRQHQEQMDHGPGLYAVQSLLFMQPVPGFHTNMLIPFTYNLPTQRSSPVAREAGSEQVLAGEQPQEQPQGGPQRRVVVRRFQVAIQLDLFLMLKLAAVIFLFNQDGSKQRLALLVFLASLVYLYQTGALASLIRWLSQGMQRAAVPPQPPRAAVRAENIPAALAQGNENGGVAGENEHHQIDGENGATGNEPAGEPGQREAGNRWWTLVKEIRVFVFGFITSLLPGFHHID